MAVFNKKSLQAFLALPQEEQAKVSHPAFQQFQRLSDSEKGKVATKMGVDTSFAIIPDPTFGQRARQVGGAIAQELPGIIPEVAGEIALGGGATKLGREGVGRLGRAALRAGGKRVNPLLLTLGAGGGQALKQIGEQIEAGTGRDIPLVRGEEAPQTSLEAAKRIGGSSLAALTGETILGAGARVGRRLAGKAGFAKGVTPEGKTTINVLRSLGLTPDPAQVTENRILDVARNATEAGFFSGNVLAKKNIEAIDAVSGVLDNIKRQSIRGSKEEIGTLAQNAIEESTNVFRATEAGHWGALDTALEAIGEAETRRGIGLIGTDVIKRPVDLSLIKATARLNKEKALKVAPRKSAQRVAQLDDIIDLPDTVSFEDASAIRSSLLETVRATGDPLAGKTVGEAKFFQSEILKVMEDAGGDIKDKNIFAMFRKAADFTKEGHEIFNNKLVKKIVNEGDVDVVVDSLLRLKSSAAIRRLRTSIIKDPEAWAGIQGEFYRKTLAEATDPNTGVVSGKRILTRIKGLNKDNPQIIQEFFPKGAGKQAFDEFRTYTKALATIQSKQPTGTGRLALEVLQAGAVYQVGSGVARREPGKIAKASAIFLIPEMMTKIFTSPKIVNFLIEGHKGLKTAGAAATYMGRLTALLEKENVDFTLLTPEELQAERSAVRQITRPFTPDQGELSFLSNLPEFQGQAPRGIVQQPSSRLSRSLGSR